MSDHAPASPGALLWRTLIRSRRALVGSVSLITLWQVCELMVPVLIGVIIDRAVATGDGAALARWAVVLIVHFAVLSTAYRLGSRIGFTAVQKESHRLRTEVSAHVLHVRGARTTQLPGDILTVATSDAEMASIVVRQVTLTAAAVLGLAVSALVLATIDLTLAVVVMVGVPVVLLVTHVLSPALARRSELRQISIGRATGIATDLVAGIRPLKGIGAEGTATARYRIQSQEAVRTSVAAARWEGLLYGVTQTLSGAFLAVVALLAGTRALEGSIGIGELVAVVGLAQFIAEPMALLAHLVAQVAQSRASAGRIVAFLATPRLVETGDRSVGTGGRDLDGVSHGPRRPISITAGPGQLVGVVAEDPADAAALMTLLRGEARATTGTVHLGGSEVCEIRTEDARGHLLVVDHHIDLFEGTLRSNIDPAGVLSPDRWQSVLDASAAVDIVTASECVLDEPVSVNATTFSGGQRQRIGLARALAADPPVLVLHDPTTAVDAVTEHRIAAGVHAIRHGDRDDRTTLVLTSSPALLALADQVVHLRQGEVVGLGSHHALSEHDSYRTAVLR